MAKGKRQDNGRYGSVFSDKLTKEFLEKEYTQNKNSAYKIADMVGCTPKIVYNYLDIYNIPRINMKGNISIGDVFGLLTTISIESKSTNGTYIWKCQCSCGNIVYIPTSRLKCGRAKSCGCFRKRKRNHIWKGYGDVSGNRISEIRCRAKKKGMDFDLTAEFLWNLWLKQKGKCAISGLEISLDKNASVDRIDSAKGYTTDNVWWVHQDVNKMKMDINLEVFLDYCRIITHFRNGGMV